MRGGGLESLRAYSPNLTRGVVTVSGVGSPPDTALPMFVYGALRPGELAHQGLLAVQPQLRTRPARLSEHEIRLRDGLPFLKPGVSGRVTGDLLDLDQAGYKRACAYEPRDLYKWSQVTVGTDSGPVQANTLLGKRLERGTEPESLTTWTGASDPLFAFGVPALGDQALRLLRQGARRDPRTRGFWDQAVALQGAFLTAWTVAERLSVLAFGPDLGPVARIKALDAWEPTRAAVDLASPPFVRVHDSQDASAPVDFAEKPFEAWYTARSNLSHRGKAATADVRLLRDSLMGLHDVLRQLLAGQVRGLADVWREEPGRLVEPWLLSVASRCDTHHPQMVGRAGLTNRDTSPPRIRGLSS